MTTEDAEFVEAPMPPAIDASTSRLVVRFPRPAAALFRLV
jgi:hypothetical protein